MHALQTAERFVKLMEEDGSRTVPLREIEELRQALVGTAWKSGAERDLAQGLLLRLALLKHMAAAPVSGHEGSGQGERWHAGC